MFWMSPHPFWLRFGGSTVAEDDEQVEAAVRLTAEEKIELWREDQFKRAGLRIEDARILARRTDIDVHSVLRAITKGCPPGLVMRIFL